MRRREEIGRAVFTTALKGCNGVTQMRRREEIGSAVLTTAYTGVEEERKEDGGRRMVEMYELPH